jgi:hypothetical protein
MAYGPTPPPLVSGGVGRVDGSECVGADEHAHNLVQRVMAPPARPAKQNIESTTKVAHAPPLPPTHTQGARKTP